MLLKGSGVFTADQGPYGGFELQIQILKLATIDHPGLYESKKLVSALVAGSLASLLMIVVSLCSVQVMYNF